MSYDFDISATFCDSASKAFGRVLNNTSLTHLLTSGVHDSKQESPADARVARDSSACIPPSWIFEISKLHH